MPDPVFRSSEGRTPKSVKDYVDPDEVDTAAPDFTEADTDEFDTEPVSQDEIDTETPDGETDEIVAESGEEVELPSPVRAAPPKPPKSAGGCARSVVTLFGVTAFVVLAIVFTAVYFLFYYTPANTTF